MARPTLLHTPYHTAVAGHHRQAQLMLLRPWLLRVMRMRRHGAVARAVPHAAVDRIVVIVPHAAVDTIVVMVALTAAQAVANTTTATVSHRRCRHDGRLCTCDSCIRSWG